MKGWIHTLFSALIGGTVGAATVFFAGGSNLKSIDSLTVADLTITNKAVLLNKDGKDDVVLKEGSVLANNIVLGKKFIGTQYQGQVFVGNRMFTSPDNLLETPMEQWQFFTEIGSSKEIGGEMIVRSANGAAVVNEQNTNGTTLRTGFDKESRPIILAVNNKDRSLVALANFVVPKPQDAKSATAANNAVPSTATANTTTNVFDSSSTTPATATPAVATKPDTLNR